MVASGPLDGLVIVEVLLKRTPSRDVCTDEAVLGDKLCHTFTGCGNGWNSAFHPFKDVGSWESCWNEARAAA